MNNGARQGKFVITATILIKRLVNNKGTIYGKRPPRGTQVKKVWEPLL
jgi:hypothetical protein